MMRTLILATACWVFTAFPCIPPLGAQEPPEAQAAKNPLAPFERLVGGRWHLDGSFQEFEWGVGGRSVRSRAYVMVNEEARLVSEGSWFWHPGEETIRGYFTAVEMPFELFDYTTKFEGSTMVSDLRTFGPSGGQETFVETWEFLDESHFLWKLLQETPEGQVELMSGTYSRTVSRPSSQ